MTAHEATPLLPDSEGTPITGTTLEDSASKAEDQAARFAYYRTDEFTARLTECLYRARQKVLAELAESP